MISTPSGNSESAVETASKIEKGNVPYQDVSDRAFVRGAAMALLEPHGIVPPDPSSNLRGMKIRDVAEQALLKAGMGDVARGNALKVKALQTNSDFPFVLEAIASQAVQAGWDATQKVWQRLCGTASSRDFKPREMVYVGGLGVLPKISEGNAIKMSDVATFESRSQVDRYGLKAALSYEAQTNNELSQFISRNKALGSAAAQSVDAALFKLLVKNDPVLDGGQLFNPTNIDVEGGHANQALVDTGISGASIAIGKSSMRRQCLPKHLDPLNIRPRFLLTAAEQEEDAWAACGIAGGFGEAGSDVERYMLQAGRLEPVSTPWLNGNAWYLIADPALVPLANVFFLHGSQEPSLTSRFAFDSDAFEVAVRFDFGVCAGNFRAGYRNNGVDA